MSRQIKFRAWDTTSKKMYSHEDIGEYTLEQLHILTFTDDPYTKLMQFTGLKDKNGVEIYEADVVDDNFVGVGEVKYNEKHAAFKIVYKNGQAKWFIDFFESESRLLEVIGNIHQSNGAD